MSSPRVQIVTRDCAPGEKLEAKPLMHCSAASRWRTRLSVTHLKHDSHQHNADMLVSTCSYPADAYRDLDLPKLVEQNVGRLEVIVNDAASWPIQVGQPIKDLTGDCPSLFLRQHLQVQRAASFLKKHIRVRCS